MARNGRVAKPFCKSGIFYVRRRVPQDLVGVVGKTHFLKSLNASSAAEAAQLFPAANAAVTEYFDSLRKSTGSWPSSATERTSLIHAAIEDFLAKATEAQRRFTNFAFSQAGVARAAGSDTPQVMIDRVKPSHRAQLAGGLVEELSSFLPAGPLPVPVRTELLRTLEARLPDFVSAWHLGLDLAGTSVDRRFTPPALERDPDITLPSLLNLWVKATEPSKSAHDDAKSVVRDFTSLYGDIPVAKLTRDDFEYFAEELRKLPAAMSRAERALPFAERVRMGDDASRAKAKRATRAKKLTLLKAIMARALKKHISYNPAQGLETGHKHQLDARRQMTSAEVRTLFALPIFSDPATWCYDREITDSTVAWVGLIGLVSGSRLGEIAQAQVKDVLEDEGHVALSITVTEDNLLPQDVKTPGSQRIIVIHPLVVSLGFLDYLAAMRSSGSTLLFPDVAVAKGGLRTKEVSRRLNQLVDEVIVRKEIVFYSLRHTFKARARAAGVSPDIERQMTGHASPDVSGRYGLAFVSQLADEMKKITFPMIPWSDLRDAWEKVDWTAVTNSYRQRKGES